LVRFLFGLPFAALWLAAMIAVTAKADIEISSIFMMAAAIGAAAQVLATAAMLLAMRATSFALGTAFQNAALPLSAIVGLFFGDWLNLWAWIGIAAASAGLLLLSWPERTAGLRDWRGAAFGLFSGAAFAVSANMFREAGHAAAPGQPILGASATLFAVQALQTIGLAAFLLWREPANLARCFGLWRRSLGAGFFGFAASACWFSALAIAPAGLVRAVGAVDMPMAAWAGGRWFKESLSLRAWIGGALTASGVALTALSMI
jgi:drug/metabolite transporter (DMT)-like permease